MPILKRLIHLLQRILARYIRKQVIRHMTFYCQQAGWREKEIRPLCKAAIILFNALFRALIEGVMRRNGPGYPDPNGAP